MFERFLAKFSLSSRDQGAGEIWGDARLLAVQGYAELAERFAGCSFDEGLYRLHDAESGPRALAWITEAFPEYAARVRPFGYDWLGRQFAIDVGRRDGQEPLVLLVEPGTGEALEIPATFGAFHDEELVEYRDAALASHFYDAWSSHNRDALPLVASDCVGYRVPLFLGGSDTVDNLEVIDLGVYWSVCAQLRSGVLRLPEGTTIKQVAIRG